MVNVAILGFGIVGTGTAEVLSHITKSTSHRKQPQLNLKYILVRRDFPQSPFRGQFVTDFAVIENDPDLQIVVETMGGVTAAYEMTKRALMAGKSVVTSNKELVATHGYELLALAKEKGCNYLYEAAVGGGIPIIRPLTACLAGNEISEIKGILNGTTNYILSRMFGGGLSFEEALKEAQEKGYAESDPTADVDGHDACRKICILGNLAFGSAIDPNMIPTEGIRGITSQDVTYANYMFSAIKLVGRTFKTEEGYLFAYVAPHFVSTGHQFRNVDDVFNIVSVKGNFVGETAFYGQGAGAHPTASAVVGDIVDLSKNLSTFRGNAWDNNPVQLYDIDSMPDQFFVRIQGKESDVKAYCDAQKLPVGILDVKHSDADQKAWGHNTTGILVNNINKKDLLVRLQGLDVKSVIRFL